MAGRELRLFSSQKAELKSELFRIVNDELNCNNCPMDSSFFIMLDKGSSIRGKLMDSSLSMIVAPIESSTWRT